MKLNIKLLLIAPLFVPGFSSAAMRDVSDWADQVESLLTTFSTIEQSFANDITLYQGLASNLDSNIAQFDAVAAERQNLIQVVQSDVAQLTSQLAQAQTDTLNTTTQDAAVISGLQTQINNLTAQTQAEIADLNQQITELNSELAAAQQSYAALVNSDAQKAADIINQLTTVSNTYQGMLDSRTAFLASLQNFTNKALGHLALEQSDIENLQAALAGQNLSQPAAPAGQ